MLTKKQIQFVQSLKDVSARRESHCFLVEGPKLLAELLESGFTVQFVYATDDWAQCNKPALLKSGIPCEVISKSELSKISSLNTPNQVLAVAGIPPLTLDWNLVSNNLTLMLDGIQDPGNLGTIIRIADWFGIAQIICSIGSVDVYNPKVVQSTMGSVFRVKVFYEELYEFLTDLPEDLPVYGAFLDGVPLSDCNLSNHGILIIGSESHGVSEKVGSLIKNRIKIPAFHHTGHPQGAESLNASVAAAILCYKFRFDTHVSGHHC
ncbi:MAG: TrmH family RNA methyltransferase [Bacteroidales bacterium]